MCTAATYKTQDFYFGRTLDYEFSYGDEITVTPRNYPFHFRHMSEVVSHYAMIGMAHVAGDYPLYYDAVNEKGLAMAGLNFVGNAVYQEVEEGRENVAQFEFIPWILSKCATVESMKDGMHIYDNPVGVLTNNPPFEQQMFQLNNYIGLSPKQPENRFSDKLDFNAYSRGMGALGLPGDLSSASRFAKVAFTKMNSFSGTSEKESVSQFFHILGSVDQQRGCCEVADGKFEITLYTSCCNTNKGIYYYTTYENHQISAVDMFGENLNEKELIKYPLIKREQIYWQN